MVYDNHVNLLKWPLLQKFLAAQLRYVSKFFHAA